MIYGSENGGEWLLELERMTSLYLPKAVKKISPGTLERDLITLSGMKEEMLRIIERGWYLESKLKALLRVVEQLEHGIKRRLTEQ